MIFIKKLRSFNLFLLFNYAIGFIYAKVFFKKANLIRIPFYLRNEGKFIYDEGLTLAPNTLIEIFGEESILQIGKNFTSYYNLHIGCCDHISIGDNVLVASNVYISDHQHGNYKNLDEYTTSVPFQEPVKRQILTKAVSIGDNVWIGEGAKILPGTIIGNGSIIGAGSVVTKNIPENSISVGSPAKVIKYYSMSHKTWLDA